MIDNGTHPEMEWELRFVKTNLDGPSSDYRQLQEIAWARLYAKHFGHGAAGHNSLLVIAKMADLLDRYEEKFGGLSSV
jgi:hypothetical protein